MKEVKIGLLGLGTVGGGTAKILTENLAEIQRRLGTNTTIVIQQIAVRDLNRPRSFDTQDILLTTSPLEVVNNPDIDIVVELMGGTSLAKDCLIQAIKNKKHIVTANKALIAEYGNELFKLAEENQVILAYEAAIAGGIPIVKALREGLAANKIDWLAGIINGTGNYILTEMKKPDADFASVLKVAQDLGYAEADPTFDVEGIDAAHKLTILASIAFGIPLQFDAVYTEGISQITADDIQFASQFGYEIKHLGMASRTETGFSLRVHPTLVPKTILLSHVSDVMNAVMVQGDAVGPTLYYGPGAGAGPTASAVVADIIDVIRMQSMPMEERIPGLGFALNQLKTATIERIEDIISAYYLRLTAKDHVGVLAKVTQILAEFDISIELFKQISHQTDSEEATLVMITNQIQEAKMNAALETLNQLVDIEGNVARIRVASLGQDQDI